MRKLRQLGFFPLIVGGFAIYYLHDVWGERFETFGYGGLCVALVVILIGLLIIRALLGPKNDDQEPPVYSLQSLLILGLLSAYAAGQLLVGFPVATLALAAVMLWWLGFRRPKAWFLASLGLTGLSYVILGGLLNVPLPMGLLGG